MRPKTKSLKAALKPILALGVLLAAWSWGGRERKPTFEEEYPMPSIAAVPDDVIDPTHFVIDLQDQLSDSAVQEFAEHHGLVLEELGDMTRDERIVRAVVPADHRRERLAALKSDPSVEYVENDYIFHAYYEPNDPEFKYQWHMTKIRAPEAWDVAEGQGVTVAVIDTGVAYEKYKNFFRCKDFNRTDFVKPWNFLENNEHANDDHGHGTHVAGTIAESTNNGIGVTGVAYKARIMPLKVLSASGAGSISAISKSIRYAADNGAKIINMSLGGPLPARVLSEACDYAKKKGCIIVCAAGNSSRRGQKGEIGYPARFKSCMAVSSTRFDDTRAWYSSYGKELAIAAPGGDTAVDQNGDGKPDGVYQNTINPRNPSEEGYFFFQGTSMACPHVAGAAALVMSLGVTDPDAVQRVLMQSARKPEVGYNWEEYGAGILDVQAAVTQACFWYDLYRLIAAVALSVFVFRQVRRRTGRLVLPCPGYLLGMLVGCCGFFFLSLTHMTYLPFKTLLYSGFPQWGIALLGAEAHEDPFFYSAATPLILVVLAMGAPRWRRVVAGFSLGVGAHLLFAALVHLGSIQSMGHFERPWLVANGLVCLGITYLVYAVIAREKN